MNEICYFVLYTDKCADNNTQKLSMKNNVINPWRSGFEATLQIKVEKVGRTSLQMP